MGGDMDNAQVLVSQHHCIFIRAGKFGIDLGVARKVVARHIDGVLAEGVGNGGIYLVGHCHIYHPSYIAEGSLAAQLGGAQTKGLGGAIAGIGYALHGNKSHIQHIYGAGNEFSLMNCADGIEAQLLAPQLFIHLQGIAHAAHIANDQRAAALVDARICQSLYGNFGAVSKGITHGNANNGSIIHVTFLLCKV